MKKHKREVAKLFDSHHSVLLPQRTGGEVGGEQSMGMHEISRIAINVIEPLDPNVQLE